MKKVVFFLLVFLLLFISPNVYALKSNSTELSERNICDKFELALANEDDTLTSISCYEEYNEAKKALIENESDNAVILEKVSGKFKIIDAKYALVYLDRGDKNTNVYTTSSLKNAYTYMNNYNAYGGTDGAFLELNYANKAVKIKISGVVGWISNSTYTIIPISWVKSSGYYINKGDSYYHYYAKNIENNNYVQFGRALGPKLSVFEDNKKYYSYDGIYFYDELKKMLVDYQNNDFVQSINYDKPYYNYYLYLPHRSKTTYSLDDLDVYIRSVMNYQGSNYGKKSISKYSVIYGQSDFYLNAEKLYGANALSVFSLSRNESANGTSSIAINKNNIFGHNAVDGSAYNSATGYLDVRSSIYTHAYGFINYGYSEVADSRYYGGHFGNKNMGMNVKYASDPYWGEKAVSYYYSFDKDNGLSDYNYYQLGLTNNTNLNARSAPSTSSTKVYAYKNALTPLIIVEKVKGSIVNGSDVWYKVQADSNLNSANTAVVSANANWPLYNWNSYVYVHSSYVVLINDAKKEDGTYNKPIDVKTETISSFTYKTYATKSEYTPIVGILKNDTDYYYSSSLINKKGTAKSGSYVVILEEARNDLEVRYLIITDYSKYQKAWISGDNVNIIKKDLLGYLATAKDSKIDIYNKPNGTDIGDIYANNYLPILEKEENSADVWVKVQFTINPITYGYVKIGDNMSYTFNNLNHKPVITANDFTIYLGEKIDLLKGVSAYDVEDGDLTDKIKVSGSVDINTPGTYVIKYSVEDKYGETVTLSVNVYVVDYKTGQSLFMYNSFNYLQKNTFEISGFLGVKGRDNIKVRHILSLYDELTNNTYYFELKNWQEYPYEMSSLDDEKKYNYSGGWFKDNIDLGEIPSGNYQLFITAYNGEYETTTYYTNIAYAQMTRRVSYNNRGYAIDIDYTTSGSPLILTIRDNGLISNDVPTTMDPMYNFFSEFSLKNNKLTLKGTSHSVGMSFAENDVVNRELILENIDNFERYSYTLGSIIDGDYPITLAVSDNCDKTRAWYYQTLDLEKLPKGSYAVYIKNTVNGISYHGELIDIAYTDFSKINNDNYIFSRNNERRLRVELLKK